jgi:hypothetical protein
VRLNRGKFPPYRPWMFEIVLIAIIADPTALVYSFQARRPPTRMPRGLSHCCNNFNAATAASFNPALLKICQSSAKRAGFRRFDRASFGHRRSVRQRWRARALVSNPTASDRSPLAPPLGGEGVYALTRIHR